MSVEFNEPAVVSNVRPQKQASGLSRFVIKTGIVKTHDGAQLVLLGIGVVALVIAGYFFFHSSQAIPPAPTPQQVQL